MHQGREHRTRSAVAGYRLAASDSASGAEDQLTHGLFAVRFYKGMMGFCNRSLDFAFG